MRRAAAIGLSALILAAVIALAISVGVRVDDRPTATDPVATVTVDGTGLLLDGEPWWPVGYNAYQLTTDWSLNVGCGAQVNLDEYFGALPPRSLTRFALLAPSTVRADDGTIDYAAADAVFAAAARHHQLVLPVLASGDGACDGETVKDIDFYRGQWRTRQASAHGSYADWVRTAVQRWHDAPALVGWTAVGEPEPVTCLDAACTAPSGRTCAPDAAEVLRTFYDDVGALIDEIDPDHLIFAGLLGGDQCGSAGPAYANLGASPGIDVLEYHLYPTDALVPVDARLPARIEIAKDLNKPLLVAEVGIKAGSCRPLAQRAELLRAEIDTTRDLGSAGALVWSYVPDPRPSECTYDIGPGDPLWPRLN